MRLFEDAVPQDLPALLAYLEAYIGDLESDLLKHPNDPELRERKLAACCDIRAQISSASQKPYEDPSSLYRQLFHKYDKPEYTSSHLRKRFVTVLRGITAVTMRVKVLKAPEDPKKSAQEQISPALVQLKSSLTVLIEDLDRELKSDQDNEIKKKVLKACHNILLSLDPVKDDSSADFLIICRALYIKYISEEFAQDQERFLAILRQMFVFAKVSFGSCGSDLPTLGSEYDEEPFVVECDSSRINQRVLDQVKRELEIDELLSRQSIEDFMEKSVQESPSEPRETFGNSAFDSFKFLPDSIKKIILSVHESFRKLPIDSGIDQAVLELAKKFSNLDFIEHKKNQSVLLELFFTTPLESVKIKGLKYTTFFDLVVRDRYNSLDQPVFRRLSDAFEQLDLSAAFVEIIKNLESPQPAARKFRR